MRRDEEGGYVEGEDVKVCGGRGCEGVRRDEEGGYVEGEDYTEREEG